VYAMNSRIYKSIFILRCARNHGHRKFFGEWINKSPGAGQSFYGFPGVNFRIMRSIFL